MRWSAAIVLTVAVGAQAAPRPECDADRYFHEILKHPRTVADLQHLRREIERDHPDKTHREIDAIYERETRTFIAELHRQARQLAQNECHKVPPPWRPHASLRELEP